MITLVEALRFRSLRYVSQPMGPFHVLVGPNASGKTTLLDVIAFLGDVVSEGPDWAVEKRTRNFQDLVWKRQAGETFQLAVELRIPDELQEELEKKLERKEQGEIPYETVRYELEIGLDGESNEVTLFAETVVLKETDTRNLQERSPQRDLFPDLRTPPDTILTPRAAASTRKVINKVPGGNDNFYSETYKQRGGGWVPSFKLGPRRSALANLPEDERKFPVATWLKNLLTSDVQQLVLNSLLIRKASPPGRSRTFQPDGSNLPWVVDDLQQKAPDRIDDWVSHLRTALPDLEGIRTVLREDDRHRYLMLRYRGGLEIPSWMASDGTLRLLALTLPAYLPDLEGVYLIEEPENGIHPRAVETMFQSLSSVYGAQILLASHSPVILSLVEADQLLCFAKDDEGATDIVLGSQHPALRNWRSEADLATLFAAGVLG